MTEMKLVTLSALLLTGVVAVAHGQAMCLQPQVQECTRTTQPKITAYLVGSASLDSLPEMLDDLDACFKKAQEMCNDYSGAEYLTDFMNVLRDLVNQESELHKKFIRNSKCLLNYPNAYLSQSTCMDELKKSAESLLQPTPEKINEFSRKICQSFHRILDCVYRDIRRVCSAEASEVVVTLMRPMAQMTTQNCIEAGFSVGKAEYSVGGAGNSALSWTLLAAVSLLYIVSM